MKWSCAFKISVSSGNFKTLKSNWEITHCFFKNCKLICISSFQSETYMRESETSWSQGQGLCGHSECHPPSGIFYDQISICKIFLAVKKTDLPAALRLFTEPEAEGLGEIFKLGFARCWAAVYGVAQSQKRLKWLSSSSSSSRLLKCIENTLKLGVLEKTWLRRPGTLVLHVSVTLLIFPTHTFQ